MEKRTLYCRIYKKKKHNVYTHTHHNIHHPFGFHASHLWYADIISSFFASDS